MSRRDRVAGMLSSERAWRKRILATVVMLICAAPGSRADYLALSQTGSHSGLQGVLKGAVQSSGRQLNL